MLISSNVSQYDIFPLSNLLAALTGRTRRFSSKAGTKPHEFTMESVRSEINKTLNSLTSRSFCSPKQQICVQGPPGMQGPKGSRGRRGARGATGRKGPRGDRGEPGKHGKQGSTGSPGLKGGKGDPRSSWSQGDPWCKGRNWRIHFTSHSSDLPDESNSHRESKCRVPVFCQRKSHADCHVGTSEKLSFEKPQRKIRSPSSNT